MIIPTDSKDVQAIRTFLESMHQQACSLADSFADPIKAQFRELGSKLKGALSQLPATDVKGDWSVSELLQTLFASLASSNVITSHLSLELNKLKGTATVAGEAAVAQAVQARLESGEWVSREAVAQQVEAAVMARTEAGDLVAKDRVDQLCHTARANGLKEGREQLEGELAAAAAQAQVITARKEALTQAGLPVPEAEALLADTEENFTAARTRFETRQQALTEAGITLASDDTLLVNLWLGDAEYGVFERTVRSIPALQRSGAEPFAGRGTSERATPTRFVV